MWNRIKHCLGLEHHSEYIKNFFDESNYKSSIYMALVVIGVESWMLISLVNYLITSGKPKTIGWIMNKAGGYLILMAAGIAVLIYAIRYLRGKTNNKILGHLILYIFSAICIWFGTKVSINDYAKGDQIFSFTTMLIFVACLLVWRTWISFAILTGSFMILWYLCDKQAPTSFAFKVNLFTLWLTCFMIAISTYMQRLSEAHKDERLVRANKELEDANKELNSLNTYLDNISRTDELTGISNMFHFWENSRKIIRNAEEQGSAGQLIFLFLDIENFKNYNEKYGFDKGSLLIKNLAKCLANEFADGLVSRFSDDHFVLLTDQPVGVLEERIEKVRTAFVKQESEVQLGLAAGAYAMIDGVITPEFACDHARTACQASKKDFGTKIRMYDRDFDRKEERKKYIINNIDNAVQNHHIKVFYQPVMWAKNCKLCGFEALARWDDPTYGMLSPAAFIPVLEEYHQICKIDKYVIEQVCRDLHQAIEEGRAVVPVSVNLSRRDFACLDMTAVLEENIKKYNLDRHLIDVEITESALTDSTDILKREMNHLHELGYDLWLDDFGSGYSSMNTLMDYQFEVLKIDMVFLQSFETNPKTKPIIEKVIQMANQIGIRTLSEGVETETEADFLRKAGCERLQGYYFGKPQPMSEQIERIDRGEIIISDEFMEKVPD